MLEDLTFYTSLGACLVFYERGPVLTMIQWRTFAIHDSHNYCYCMLFIACWTPNDVAYHIRYTAYY